jgi:hypothetical protein
VIALTNSARFPLTPDFPQETISEIPPLLCGEALEHPRAWPAEAEIGATTEATTSPAKVNLILIRAPLTKAVIRQALRSCLLI